MSQRSVFLEKTTKLLNKYQGKGSIYLFSADFVNFKLINYHYGFDRGDELIQSAIDFVRHIPECICCERVAADHFFFIIFTKTPHADEEMLAFYSCQSEQFLAEHRNQYPACNLKFWCGIYEVKDSNIAAAIDNANLARLDAKRTGAATAVLSRKSRLNELAEERRREKEIMRALNEDRFTFFLQPQVDLKTGEIVGAEALVREYDLEGNLIYPDSFIPILEKNGGIIQLDYLVLEKVCEYMKYRLDRGEPVVRTSINLSRQHIWHAETADYLHAIVTKYDIPPHLIVFELTENILIKEFSNAKLLGNTLHSFGYKTSIDDFGSGYAGINIWQHLSFDELKLDRQFLSGDGEFKSRNKVIVWGIVEIARRLCISVICEGVERAEQCRGLLELGCRYAQGYYFSRPISPDDFYRIYHDRNGHYELPYGDIC